jgi:hypothetical protein
VVCQHHLKQQQQQHVQGSNNEQFILPYLLCLINSWCCDLPTQHFVIDSWKAWSSAPLSTCCSPAHACGEFAAAKAGWDTCESAGVVLLLPGLMCTHCLFCLI